MSYPQPSPVPYPPPVFYPPPPSGGFSMSSILIIVVVLVIAYFVLNQDPEEEDPEEEETTATPTATPTAAPVTTAPVTTAPVTTAPVTTAPASFILGSNKVIIKGGNKGKYCTGGDSGQPITCGRDVVGDWEKFTLEIQPDGKIALKGGKDNKYCSDKGNEVKCDTNVVEAWEKFSFTNNTDGTTFIKGSNKGFNCTDEDNQKVACGRAGDGAWQKFTVFPDNPRGNMRNGVDGAEIGFPCPIREGNVTYGANGKTYTKALPIGINKFTVNSSTMGGDPIPGVAKSWSASYACI
jgi:hypothetical protein